MRAIRSLRSTTCASREISSMRVWRKRSRAILINLTIFRFDDLSTLLIKLGPGREGTYRIVPLPNATETRRQIYRNG